MNKLLKYPLFLFISAFAACSSEDDIVPPVPAVQPQSGDVLELTVSAGDFVTDGAPDTRATDNDKTTTFESSDRVGVIILNEDGQPIYNNIPYKYDSNKWVFDSDNGEGKDMCYYDSKARTYIVYYPYHKDADGCKSENDLKAKFVPQSDQSTKENYRASDLMVCTTTSGTPLKSLAAELKHAYASVSLSLTATCLLDDEDHTKCYLSSPKVFNINFTINDKLYVLFQISDGSLRCILPPGFTTGDIRCFYAFGDKTYSNTIKIAKNVVANTRYTSAVEINHQTYSLDDAKVGDFYCRRSDNNGYLIPSEVALTKDQKAACVGIVMKVGKDDVDLWKDDCDYKFKGSTTKMNTIHGYVLALHDAGAGQWGSGWAERAWVGTDTKPTTNFYGYKNTQTIISFNGTRELSATFPATYHATKGYESKNYAPDNSSGWFLPSAGQCWYWFQSKDILLTSIHKAGGDGWPNYYYWSSSEYNDYLKGWDAWYVSFMDGNMHAGGKLNNSGVRSLLAF